MDTRKIEIVALGDSITYGFPYSPNLSWVYLVARELGIQITNEGINGDTTTGMLSRFIDDVLKYKPSYVTIVGGVNDAFAGFRVDKFADNIRMMTEMALSNSVIPVIGLPTPCNFQAEEALLGKYRKAIESYAVSANIDIIDFYSALVDVNTGKIKTGLDYDGIHPNEAGYKVLASMATSYFDLNLQRNNRI